MSVEAIYDLYLRSANEDYIGENVSQLEHACQAAHFARAEGADDEAVLAALLHDVGHICYPLSPKMADLGVFHHEYIGGGYLKRLGFSPKIVALVSAHVNAKRYLTFKDQAYRENLSEASLGTLRFQGGPMNEEEARAFEADPLFAEKVSLRHWDEKAKVVGLSVEPLEAYLPLLRKYSSREDSAPTA